MDLLCAEEMMEDTPEGAYAGPNNRSEIENRRQLSEEMNFSAYLDTMPCATEDKNLAYDPRVLPSLLKMEEKLQSNIQPNYFKTVQTDITPESRASVTTWMFEVCEEERMMECVFLRAVSYIDRVLSVSRVEVNQLQLLGATCLLLSCKWSGVAFSIDRLVAYTANSVPRELLLDWEIMVVHAIKWDLGTIVPSDFVQHFLTRLPKHLWDSRAMDKVRTFMAYCATDPTFIIHTPSIIAAASLALAVGYHDQPEALNDILHQLHDITSIETDVIRSCMEQINVKTAQVLMNSRVPGSSSPGNKLTHLRTDEPMAMDKLEELGQAETPTDVGDIHF